MVAFFFPLPFWNRVVYLEDDALCTALLGSQDAGFSAEGSKGENEHTGRRDCETVWVCVVFENLL